jgi:protein-tyrosine phosphatase
MTLTPRTAMPLEATARPRISHCGPRLALAFLLTSIAWLPHATRAQATQSAAPTIGTADCERLADGTYRIAYETERGAGRVRVFASRSADRLDGSTPLVTATASPVTVSVPDRVGRVYFHLQPEQGPTRVVATRRLPLEGAVNFRDLGGYRTADGRFVKWGLLFRTDHLAGLTARDYQYLATLGLRLVCDLRTPFERQRDPVRWQGAEPEMLSAPMLSDAQLQAAPAPLSADEFRRRYEVVASGRSLSLPLSSSYKQFVTDYASSYRQVFRRLVQGDLPAVTNCTAGQDRTGIYSAILLTALGVPRDTVVADYLLTSRYRITDAVVEERRREWKTLYGVDATPAEVRALQGLRAESVPDTFAHIDATYGSFDAFRRGTLGLSDDELARLRTRLLEP